MITKRSLKHVAGGFLGSFMSRNNDFQGYWALGVLYTEVRAAGRRVEFDLLAGAAYPAASAGAELAPYWSGFLREALLRQGASPDALQAATVSLVFGLPPVPKRPGRIEYGQPFLCFLRLLPRDGSPVLLHASGHCMPHTMFAGRRGTRYSA